MIMLAFVLELAYRRMAQVTKAEQTRNPVSHTLWPIARIKNELQAHNGATFSKIRAKLETQQNSSDQ